jgi:hypothetical protein
MSELDALKEELNTIRAGLAILIVIVVGLTSGLINRFDNGKIDLIFISGIIFDIAFILSIPILIKKLIKKTNQIRSL